MRPPNARESKAFGTHFEGEGDERPGVGPECLCGRPLTCGPAIREVVVGPRRGESRARDWPSTWRSVTLRMVMDSRAGVSRLRDIDPRTSRMLGEAARVVPRAGGTADPTVIGTSRMAGDHHGARTDCLVLGRAPTPAASCPGSLARRPTHRRPQSRVRRAAIRSSDSARGGGSIGASTRRMSAPPQHRHTRAW